jgi:hypothetical protein
VTLTVFEKDFMKNYDQYYKILFQMFNYIFKQKFIQKSTKSLSNKYLATLKTKSFIIYKPKCFPIPILFVLVILKIQIWRYR